MLDPTSRYKNLSSYVDRCGKVRWKYRRGSIHATIRGQPGEPEFEAVYLSLCSGDWQRPPPRESAADQMRRRLLREVAKDTLKRARTRAVSQQVAFSLEVSDLEKIMARQDWRCALSGRLFWSGARKISDVARPFRPSLDRIKPRDGYIISNVRFVCMIVNLAMSDWGEEALIEISRQIVDRHSTSAKAAGIPVRTIV